MIVLFKWKGHYCLDVRGGKKQVISYSWESKRMDGTIAFVRQEKNQDTVCCIVTFDTQDGCSFSIKYPFLNFQCKTTDIDIANGVFTFNTTYSRNERCYSKLNISVLLNSQVGVSVPPVKVGGLILLDL